MTMRAYPSEADRQTVVMSWPDHLSMEGRSPMLPCWTQGGQGSAVGAGVILLLLPRHQRVPAVGGCLLSISVSVDPGQVRSEWQKSGQIAQVSLGRVLLRRIPDTLIGA